MSDPDDPLAWIDRAEEDYTAARALLRRKIPLVYAACFHAQQCAEKYLKALLTAQKIEFPKTHDLLALNTLCAQAGIFMGMTPVQLGKLSSHALKVRYPGEDPTLEEAREALEIARAVRRFGRKFFGLR